MGGTVLMGLKRRWGLKEAEELEGAKVERLRLRHRLRLRLGRGLR